MPNIGLVGCGRWGRLILRDLLSLGAAVCVAATKDDARFAKAAGAEVVSHLDHLPDVDGVIVATPTSTHADVIEALLPRRMPIYCEKPLCDDADRARRLAETGRGRLFVMDKWRYHLGILELAAIARSAELGPVVGLRTQRTGYGHSHTDTDCVWTLLPHDLSIAREILGRLLPPLSAVADFADGQVAGLIAVSATDGGPWHVAEIGVRSPLRQRAVTLSCRDGVAILEDAYAEHLVIVSNPGGETAEPPITRRSVRVEMPLLAELSAFVDHLKGGPPPKSSAEEGAETVATIAKIRRLAAI
jgi:predicted dehydrogenase